MSGTNPDNVRALDENEPTPHDHQVLALSIEAALLPEWFEAIKRLAGTYARRMTVLEKPDAWIVKIELRVDSVGSFSEELNSEWSQFVAGRRAEGRWNDA